MFVFLGDNYEQLKDVLDYIIKNKVSKEYLENYFKYLFIQVDHFINKYEEKPNNHVFF
jgi:hypothetical protein